jgi:predicted Rdx family selenoprotein
MNIRLVIEEQTALINYCAQAGDIPKAADMAQELADTIARHCKVYKINPTETKKETTA